MIFGLLFLFGAGAIAATLVKSIPLLGAISVMFFVILGVIMLAFGVLGFFVGKRLWNGNSWVRIVAIVFACLGILNAIVSMTGGQVSGSIFGLVVNLVIGGYLAFSADVKKAFA